MEYADYLVKKKVELLEHTDVNRVVLAFCREKKILGVSDVSNLEAERRKVDQNYEFWGIIEKRKDCWGHLIEIFRRENQAVVVEILENVLKADGNTPVYNFVLNREPLEFVVAKRKLGRGESHQLRGDYQLDPDDIGMALVINITEFDDPAKNREGADQDFQYMRQLWKGMGYDVHAYVGKIDEADVEDIMEDFLDVFRKKKTLGSCVVFIGSHGRNGFIEMSNGKEIQLYDYFIKKFNDDCKLKGIPKLFFVQACQNFPEMETEAARFLSELKDTLVCFATLPGEGANRHEKLGSFFVYMLTDVFMKHAHEKEVKELLNEVSQQVAKIQSSEQRIQMSYFQAYALKPLYFNLVEKFSGKVARIQ